MNARRRFGFAFVTAGALLLCWTSGRYALGAVRADQARALWSASEAHRAVSEARAHAVPSTNVTVVAGAPVAHLVIPKIGLDEIVLEGVNGDALDAEPGHVPGSALPGERGNAVISAHRDRHFNRFAALALGDTVYTESRGRRDRWVIVTRKILDKDLPALFRTSEPTLTLTTCWPIRYLGPAPDRLILGARLVGSG